MWHLIMTRKYAYNLQVLYNEDAVSYYLLGAFITDGCVHEFPGKKNVSFWSKDKDWIEKIRDILCPLNPVKFYDGAWFIVMFSTKMGDWLISKGCTPRKSLTAKMPFVPEKFLPDFFRGCIDGDGTIGIYDIQDKRTTKERYHRQIVCALVSASGDFIDGMSKALGSKFIHTATVEMRQAPRHPLHKINTRGRNALKILDWAYYPNHPLSMPRKNDLANEVRRYYSEEYVGDLSRAYNDLNGEFNPNAKLAEHQVKDILGKWFLLSSDERNKHGSRKRFYDAFVKDTFKECTYHTLRSILRGESWKHISDEVSASEVK